VKCKRGKKRNDAPEGAAGNVKVWSNSEFPSRWVNTGKKGRKENKKCTRWVPLGKYQTQHERGGSKVPEKKKAG